MKLNRIFVFMALAGLTTSAFATNGYFSHGYGMKAKGRAGASIAFNDDTFGGANNPAAMGFAGDRWDIGVDLFSPHRSAERTDTPGAPVFDVSVDSDSDYFLIPEFGFNKMMNPDLALGVSVYGNGGMNTNYPGGQIPAGACTGFGNPGTGNLLCGSGKLGVDLMQLVIAPTLAYKVAPNHSIGIAPLIGYQRFKAEGIQPFAGFSTSPANVSNKDYDDSFGYGVRVGYQGKITPTVTIGAVYASKMNFDELSKYKGLFAQQGDFDIPENFGAGVAWQATPQLLLALDYMRINYSGVDSIANPQDNLLACMGGDFSQCLGGNKGAGFGWSDINIWKLGAEYRVNKQWLVRGGWNHGDNPISGSDVTFNILAPGVVQDNITLGFTYTTAGGGELTVAGMYALENSVSGSSFLSNFGPPFTTSQEEIKMYQYSIGVAYGAKF